MKSSKKIYDCIIIGAGPAGLTAGLYLKRFKCDIQVIHNRDSRAELIPISHNLPGFPSGIAGKKFLNELTKQYKKYGGCLISDTTQHLAKIKKNLFKIQNEHSTLYAKNIILATGVKDYEPDFPNLKYALKNGLVRHCLICDGYEVNQQKTAILCDSEKGFKEALLLQIYSKDITIFTAGKKISLSKKTREALNLAKIKIIKENISQVLLKNKKIIAFQTTDGKKYFFDAIYSALGAQVRAELAAQLGAKQSAKKYLIVNSHQETSVSGLYAAGDIIHGLNQICVAESQAAIAAVSVFNRLKNA